MSVTPGESQSTYPESWVDLPGTRTQKPGPEHANAREQEYYLQDEADPVSKGEHKRQPLRSDPAERSDAEKYFPKGTPD